MQYISYYYLVVRAPYYIIQFSVALVDPDLGAQDGLYIVSRVDFGQVSTDHKANMFWAEMTCTG